MSWFFLISCVEQPPTPGEPPQPADTAEAADTARDTAPPLPERVCAEGAGAAAADETYTARYGTLYRLVELRSPAPEVEEVHALVVFPADGQRGWEAWAPRGR